jgi:hydrogenase maturation protease
VNRVASPEPSAISETREVAIRVLCLGNDLLADDSLGSLVAEHMWQFAPPHVEVIGTPEAGFHLLDYVLNVHRLIVVDTVVTGTASPGTIHEFHENELETVPGGSPHYVGLYETLTLARCLGLPVAEEVIFLSVEAADCSTVGGAMHPAVRAAVPSVARIVRDLLHPVKKMKQAVVLEF